MSEAPVALLTPPDLPPLARTRPLPAIPLTLPSAEPADPGPVVLGAAAVDRSGRVREHVVLAALGWGRGERLDVRLVHDVAVLRAASNGRLHVDGRDQIALPSGCRATLGIAPGDRVILAALPAPGVALVLPIRIAVAWIRALAADLLEVFDA